jgi:hypothetical protein
MAITVLQGTNNANLSSGIVPIHAALVPSPTGPVIAYFDGFQDAAYVYDVGAPKQPPVLLGTNPGWRAFCAGHAFLNDGRWVIAGGVVDQNVPHHGPYHDSGPRECEMYAPFARAYSPIEDMNFQPGGDHGGGRWYPTVLTVTNGEVLAVAGHPFIGKAIEWNEKGEPIAWDTAGMDDYVYAPGEGPRHNNNTPERYSPTRDRWTLLTAESSSHDNQSPDEYPRLHLAPSGHVFFSTIAKGDLRFYDPYSGTYDGTTVSGGSSKYHQGSAFSSVLLPVLPGDLKNVWVLACGAANTEKINIASGSPAWEAAGASVLGKDRVNVSAVILPTGSVFVSGGEVTGGPETPAAELYHPPIDWDQLKYTTGPGQWEGTDTPQVKRGYHSVALLMPDGRVWIAGSTWSDWSQDEKRMEVYTPPYIQAGRVEITEAPPSVGYGASFDVELSSEVEISRVVLIRCGSVTHSFDSDQRYVVCRFRQTGDHLEVTAPEGPGIAPPGNYMLFVLDSQIENGHGRPCVRAAMIRVCDQECIPVNNVSTYSKLAVKALKVAGKAVFPDAVWLFLENFLPHEANYPTMPAISISWDSPAGPAVDPTLFSLKPKDPWSENDSLPPDVAQRFALRYDVQVSQDAFDQVNVQRDLFVRWDLGHFQCSTMLRLTTEPNPYMVDVAGGNPHWLSTDLRVFSVRAGATPPTGAPSLASGETPLDYLAKILGQYNGSPNESDHPFLDLKAGQESSALELRPTVGSQAVYNFAVAKVRYVGQGKDADDVRVFFRMFNTVGTALDFDSKTTYRRTGNGPGAVPLLGHVGSALVSIPFFETQRVTPGTKMPSQPPDTPRTLLAQGAAESVAYFGAWLDINQMQPHIPPLWVHDGPFQGLAEPYAPESILGLVRNYHQCLIAEVHFSGDPIPDAADPNTQLPGTPANNDNLSQRNLAWVPVGNPGGVATRTAQTTFVARPSGSAPTSSLMPVRIVPRSQVLRTRRLRRRGPDELIFDGSALPAGTRVTVYMPDVDVDEVLELAARRPSPVRLVRVDPHTVAFEPRSVAYLPLPGGRVAPIPGLISVELPPNIHKGEEYRLVIHQLSGERRRVIGTFQLEVPVFHEPELLEPEIVKLSVLKWILTRIPSVDPWLPVFQRYVGEISERVRGFGGDPDAVEPLPEAEGRPGDVVPGRPLVGKVSEVRYDCFGDFVGFVLSGCEGGPREFESREPGTERLVLRACRNRCRLEVAVDPDNEHRFLRITILCS